LFQSNKTCQVINKTVYKSNQITNLPDLTNLTNLPDLPNIFILIYIT